MEQADKAGNEGVCFFGHGPVGELYLCEGCQRGYRSRCIQERVGPAAASLDRSLLDVSWSDPALVERWSTWRCGVCARVIGGVSARWGNPFSRLAALCAQRGLLLTLFSPTFTPARSCRRPASCTVVSLRERIRMVTSDAGLVDDLRCR